VLAQRMRDLIGLGTQITETKMFGGLAFLVNGNMAVAASGTSGKGLMVRVTPEEGENLIATTNATGMEMRGRVMTSWLRVAPEYLASDEVLEEWVQLGLAYARSLPPKKK
jgi:TfoX/Sxy family transcriptional regulator of competence genes